MVEYFIYRNTHRKRARTHLAECRMCDHGRWQPTDINKRGIWLGPFDRSQASEVAEQLVRDGIDVQPCNGCEP
jgi:hypothetical protein